MEITNMYSTIDAHTAGALLRSTTGGLPEIKGETILHKRAVETGMASTKGERQSQF